MVATCSLTQKRRVSGHKRHKEENRTVKECDGWVRGFAGQ